MEVMWALISDIMAGAGTVRKKSVTYLPQYERESANEYRRRKDTAPWRPEFADCLRSLASKPFGKDVVIKGEQDERIAGAIDPATKKRSAGLVDDIDGRGNGLTSFAREWFAQGIAKGMHAVLVDYPTMQPGATVAQEREAGARPYWVHVPADNIIALYTDVVGGREVITHVRIREYVIQRDGYDERKVEQIRVFEPGRWEIWERQKDNNLTLTDHGVLNRGGKKSIPLVLFFPGERIGTLEVRPPLADLAFMQVELYQALSRQEEILTFAGSPMLAGNGIAPPPEGQAIEVGPKTVLFAPAIGEGVKTGWEFVQPAAANIKEIREHVASIQEDMRRIGMQPMTEMPGNPTATGQSLSAAKAHSAVKAWALLLNDAIEQAFVFTSEWLGKPATIQTEVSTDFSVLPYAQFPLQSLAAARATRDLSRKTYLESLKRFDVLPQDFDLAEETKLLEAEAAQEALDDPEQSEEPAPTEAVNVRL